MMLIKRSSKFHNLYSVKQWLILLQKKGQKKLIDNIVTKYSKHVRTTCSAKITQSILNIHFSHKTSLGIRKHCRWSKINGRDNYIVPFGVFILFHN